MPTWKCRSLAALAAAGLAAQGVSAHAQGPTEGVARVSDVQSPAPAPVAASTAHVSSGAVVSGPVYADSAYGYCPPDECHGHGCPGFGGLGHGLGCDPAAGWSRPVRNPIYRLPVHYQKFWPNGWYGSPGAVYAPVYPMVYHPTDTTQFGFYYQRVPYWQPNPAMVPQIFPNPQEWHYTAAGLGSTVGYPVVGGAPIEYGAPITYASGATVPTEVRLEPRPERP